MSRTSQRWVYGAVGVALLAVAGLFAVKQVRGPDYLARADAYAKLGQLDSTEALLRQHVIRHPRDLGARVRFATLVLKRGDTSTAVRVLEEVQGDASGKDSVSWNAATRSLRDVARAQARGADSVSQVLARRGLFDSSAAYANSAAVGYVRARSLDTRLGDTTRMTRLIDDIYVAWASAQQVMASHLGSGTSQSSYSLIEATPVTTADAELWKETLRRSQYLFDSIGEAAFTARRWADAEKHYLRLRSLSAIRGDSAEQARALYGAATADWNAGRYAEARRLLAVIRDTFPSYQHRDVQRRTAGAGTAEGMLGVRDILDRASSEAGLRHWQSARNYYREALRVIEANSLGTPDLVALTMYNIAVTYYNAREYADARARLLELQAKYPAFDPKLVKALLGRISP